MAKIITFYLCLWITLWFFGISSIGSNIIGLLKTGSGLLGVWEFGRDEYTYKLTSECRDGLNEFGQMEICIKQ